MKNKVATAIVGLLVPVAMIVGIVLGVSTAIERTSREESYVFTSHCVYCGRTDALAAITGPAALVREYKPTKSPRPCDTQSSTKVAEASKEECIHPLGPNHSWETH